MTKKSIVRILAAMAAGILVAGLAGCSSAREFEHRGQVMDTVQSFSLDNREPFAFPRDSWRLGPTREEAVAGVAIKMGASEDGSMIMFRIPNHFLGAKSKISDQTTTDATEAMDEIVELLKAKGYPIVRRVAIIDNANVIGYRIGGQFRVVGFYLFSNKEGAYDALLTALDERPASEKGLKEAQPIDETPESQLNEASEGPDHGGGEADADTVEEAAAAEAQDGNAESSWWDIF